MLLAWAAPLYPVGYLRVRESEAVQFNVSDDVGYVIIFFFPRETGRYGEKS